MYDMILRHCTVIDGSGGEPFRADIAVKGGVIARMAPIVEDKAPTEVDVNNQYVTPGFIDCHRHSDAFVFRPDFGEVQLRQGITTTVNGNCGLSVAPCPDRWREDILRYLKPIIGSLPDGVRFDTFGDYLERVSGLSLPINFGMHVGNGTLRMAAKGFAEGPLSRDELATVHRYLRDAVDAGAFGVSLGLAYAPENNYDLNGILAALAPIKAAGIPIVTHIRGEGGMLVDSIREVIAIARGLEAPLHISHYKCVGACNWGHLLRQATDLIEAAQADGMSITCDVYPWLAGSSLLAQILPPEFLAGGLGETTRRLSDPAERRRCAAMLAQSQTDFENQALLLGWENIMVGSVGKEENRECEGKRITEIAEMRGLDPAEAALSLLADESCEVSMINFIACDDDVDAILRLPYSIIVSDSIYPDGGRPHPRQFGTYPKILADYVRDRKVLSLETAIHKFTGKPAERFRIASKGLVREGYDADLAVFDLDKIANKASYVEPKVLGQGFSHVFVGGVPANDHDSYIKSGAGKVIRRS